MKNLFFVLLGATLMLSSCSSMYKKHSHDHDCSCSAEKKDGAECKDCKDSAKTADHDCESCKK